MNDEELSALKAGGLFAKAIFREKMSNCEYELSGETYNPGSFFLGNDYAELEDDEIHFEF